MRVRKDPNDNYKLYHIDNVTFYQLQEAFKTKKNGYESLIRTDNIDVNVYEGGEFHRTLYRLKG